MQPLEDALAEGRPVYAVIRGTAANQDGHTNGLTVPSAAAQEAVIRVACRDAGVEEAAIAYVEAHGTGTPVGDPIEALALGKAIGEARPAGSPLLIGSVKTNIGHLEAGAGVAGVIKTALALNHGQVPPSLNFEQPTPHIPFDDLNLEVATRARPLTSPALAGVNSFGFGGSNAHAILASPPPRPEPEPARDVDAVVLTLSMRARERSAAVAETWRAFLAPGGEGAEADLADICHAAATRRNHRGERMAIAARDREELVARLGMLAAGDAAPGVTIGRPDDEAPRPVFVYSGQGTQWWAMGRELLASDPIFRGVIERCDALFSDLGDWSLIEELSRDEETSRLHVTAIAQPAIFAVQAALTTLWRSWGIEPAATVGHSVGEVAAAWAGGILTLEDAARVIFHRGNTMERAPDRGRMLAAGISAEEARAIIAPYGERVSLGAINSPALMTLSGDGEPLEAIAAELEARGAFNRFLAVQYAFHSAHMDGVREDLIDALGVVPLHPARVPVFSTVTARLGRRRRLRHGILVAQRARLGPLRSGDRATHRGRLPHLPRGRLAPGAGRPDRRVSAHRRDHRQSARLAEAWRTGAAVAPHLARRAPRRRASGGMGRRVRRAPPGRAAAPRGVAAPALLARIRSVPPPPGWRRRRIPC